jgi:GTP-binding protein
VPLKLAIVGRPNVGKSTLFNRLAGKKLALVDDQPGVTRDRKMAEGRLASLPLLLIDTAGFDNVRDDSLEARMRAQTEAAIAEADLALFLVDARVGVTPEDETFAMLLRKTSVPVVLAANKAEGRQGEAGVLDAFRLGLGEPVGLSAEHGEGMAELYEAIRNALGEEAFERALEEAEPDYMGGAGDDILDKLAHIDIEDTSITDEQLVAAIEEAEGAVPEEAPAPQAEQKPIKLAIIGRPNAGKSTLINQLLKSERMLTGPEAGITRDSIQIDWEWEGRKVRLVDTAGLRRKARVQERLERMSTAETIRSLKYADIIALVMDAHDALEKQDLQIADLALREGRGLVLVISKWDTVQDPDGAARHIRDLANRLMPNAGGAPVVFLSGLTGRNTEKLMPAVVKVHKDWTAKVKTGDLNRWLRHTVEHHPPPSVQGKRIKPRYMAQMKARPPTFVLIASRGEQMPEGYKRYLVNGIREAFDMHGVPIRLFVRQGKNPYKGKVGPDGPPRYKRRDD